MYKDISMQLYSVRNHMKNIDDIRGCFKELRKIGYTGSQVAEKFDTYTYAEYAQAAKDAGIEIIGTHGNIPEDVDNIDDYVNNHKILGTTNAGIGGFFVKTVKEYVDMIEKVNRLAENLSKHGMKFTYHHHAHEFGRIDGVRPMDLLVDGFDKNNVTFVLDTYWLVHAGLDINAWIEKLAGRVDILHLKDRAVCPISGNASITEVGSGNIDFAPIIKTAAATGVKHISEEQDVWPETRDSLDCAKMSFDYLNNLLAKL